MTDDTTQLDAELKAEAEFKAMVRAFGGGYHPETPADGYTSYPEGYNPELVAQLFNALFDACLDPYELCLEVLEEDAS